MSSNLPKCPITHEVMVDPVITPNGITYERIAIEKWITLHQNDPQTRNPLEINQLIPNRDLKNLYDLENKKLQTPEIINEPSDPIEINICYETSNENKTLISIISPDKNTEDECDIIACIDTSGSMQLEVEKKCSENSGLTRFDILVHGVNTLINSCNDKHRIAIVTFDSVGTIKSNFIRTNDSGKIELMNVLKLIQVSGQTNLFDGIMKSFSLIEERSIETKNIKASIIIFTDGEPNMEPPRGYIPALQKKKKDNKYPCDINIFAYGKQVNSILSDDISRETNGTYGYIPDASFIGDLLEHKIANIRTTRIKNSYLKIILLDDTQVELIEGYNYTLLNNELTIYVGEILYGQDRNFLINFKQKPKIKCILHYDQEILETYQISETDNIAEITYHLYRQKSINLINELIDECLKNNKYDLVQMKLTDFCYELNLDIINLKSKQTNFVSRIKYDSSIEKLTHIEMDFTVQIKEAFTEKYFNVWGLHYLLSIRKAYEIQQANNFKDFGVQKFGGILFNKILDEADDIFAKLPPPKPKQNPYYNQGNFNQGNFNQPINISNFQSRYNNACFHELSYVRLEYDEYKLAKDIKKGDRVMLASGYISEVECVVKTNIKANNLIVINKTLHVTPYHPVRIDG